MSGKTKMIFLGGPPKCGTSAFFDMLKQTKLFTSSQPKETFFYIDKEYPLFREKANFFNLGHSGFYRFFDEQEVGKKTLLEGTTHLLYQKEVPEILSKLDCKIVFILRDPAERIRSSFEYTMNNLANFKESISFSEYVDLLLGNSHRLNSIMDSTSQWVLTHELVLSDYPRYLGHWNRALGKERVLVLDYADLKTEPQRLVQETIDFANLSGNVNTIAIERRNQTKVIRNKSLHKALKGVNRLIPQSILKTKIKSLYFKFQKGDRNWNEQDEAALDKLKVFFHERQPSVQAIIKQQKFR